MKKRCVLIFNERGYILPSIILMIFIALIGLTATISIYHEEMEMTKSHIEQLKIDTLIQMAYTKFKENYPFIEQYHEEVHYSFKDGDVSLTYTVLDDLRVNVYVYVETDNNAYHSTRKMITLPLLFD